MVLDSEDGRGRETRSAGGLETLEKTRKWGLPGPPEGTWPCWTPGSWLTETHLDALPPGLSHGRLVTFQGTRPMVACRIGSRKLTPYAASVRPLFLGHCHQPLNILPGADVIPLAL